LVEQSFNDALSRHQDVFQKLQHLRPQVIKMLEGIQTCLSAGGKIVWCGNGGSAADSQHLAAEFVVRYKANRPALPSIALTTDTSILTACANDFGFEQVFARQVTALMKPIDILIALSTSGNSENVNLAVKSAKQLGAKTFALTGGKGGTLSLIADQALIVESNETARVQEVHMFIGHWWCEALDDAYHATEKKSLEK
jgi:D-sedoheptulose 7-phosphate isomerase